MNDGFIKIHKKIENWQWYKDSNTKSLFIDLLLDANWQDSKNGFLTIKRGQCLTSLKRINERTGLTYQQIRTSLSKLEKSEEINKQTTNRYSIITINKYNDYQEINKQTTNKQQTNNNIKDNKDNKEIKETISNDIVKKRYGEFNNVLLTDEEYQKLKDKFYDYEEKIENLSYYLKSKGDKYKSHYATILNWSRKDEKNKNIPSWFNKEIKQEERSEEDERELQELIRGY